MSSRTILIFGIILAFVTAPALNAGVIMQTMWDGSSSTDWNDPNNWSAGVPTASVDAIIVFAANQPVINMGSPNKPAQALIMNSSSGAVSLTIASGFSLTVQKVETFIGTSPGSNVNITINGTLTIDANVTYNTSALRSTTNGTTDVSGTGVLTSDSASFIDIFSGPAAIPVSLGVTTTALTGHTRVKDGNLDLVENASFNILILDSTASAASVQVTVDTNKNINVADLNMTPVLHATGIVIGSLATLHVTGSATVVGDDFESEITGAGSFVVDFGATMQTSSLDASVIFSNNNTIIAGALNATGDNLFLTGTSFTVTGTLSGVASKIVDTNLVCSGGGQIAGMFYLENSSVVNFQTAQTGSITLITEAEQQSPAILTGSGTLFGPAATVTIRANENSDDPLMPFKLRINASGLSNDGSLTLDGTVYSLIFDLHNGAQFKNEGQLTLAADDFGRPVVTGTGSILNTSGSTLTSNSIESGVGASGEGEGEVAQSAPFPVEIQVNLINEGTLGIDGELKLTNNFTQDADTGLVQIQAANGGKLTIADGSGTATFNGGILQGFGIVKGNVVNRAVVRPGLNGSVGTLTVQGNYTQMQGNDAEHGALDLDFSDNSTFDKLDIQGNASLAHRLNFNLIGPFLSTMPVAGTRFTSVIAVSATNTGSFTTFGIDSAVDNANRYFNPDYVSSNVDIVFRSVPIPQAQSINVTTGTPFSGTLVSTDADNDSPEFQIQSQPAKGTVTVTNSTTGAFTYTANAGATGTDTFDFRVFDGARNSKFNAVVMVNLASGAADPIISSVTATPDVALLNAAVVFSVSATDPASRPLTYLWDFKDGTAVGTTNPVSHAFTTAGTYAVSVTVSNGASIATMSVNVQVLTPNSGGETIVNVGDGKPPVSNPLSGITLKVTSSNGGVVELAVDLDALIRDEFDVNTSFDTIKGRQNVRKGLRPTEKFVEPGVAVATTVATDTGTANERGKARRQIAVSSREVGQMVPFTAPPVDRTIENKSMKGKFLFSSEKPDQFTFTGMFELPAGLDLTQDRTLEIGIGNVVDSVTISAKGKSSGANKNRINKAQLKYPKLPKGSTVTVAGQKAQLTLTMKGVNFSTQGFDTEGIAATLRGDEVGQKAVDRSIQTAISFAGSTWEGSIPVEFKLAKKADSGTIQGRRAN